MWRTDSLEKTLMLGGLGAGGEGDDREWDCWMASSTHWTWVWVNSGSWWWIGKCGVLKFMGSQRVAHDWPTELNWTELLDIWISSLEKCLFRSSTHVFVWAVCFFYYWTVWAAYIVWRKNHLSDISFANISSCSESYLLISFFYLLYKSF